MSGPTQWLDAFVTAVRTNDTTAGRALFDPGVIGFGTRTPAVDGLDDLVSDQWTQVWPLVVDWQVSAVNVVITDPDWAVLAYRWRRTNRDGSIHCGRATMVLVAADHTPLGWRCTHSHFSVDPT